MSVSRFPWRVPAYLPHVQPQLNDVAIADAQRRLGITLPAAYLDALREQNGGRLRYGVRGFEIADEIWGIGPRWPSILEGSIARHEGEGWIPDGADKLVAFCGDGHWYLCFDARGGRPEPTIAWIDLEQQIERPAFASFAELVTQIVPGEDRRQIGIASAVELDEVARRLSQALRLEIIEPCEIVVGYRSINLRAKSRRRKQVAWISTNESLRGVVREDHRDYAALVGTMPGTALRVPEHPDCAFFLDGRELTHEQMLDACARAGLDARVV